MLGVIQSRGTTDDGIESFHIVFSGVDTALGQQIDEVIGYAMNINNKKFICGIQSGRRSAKDKNV